MQPSRRQPHRQYENLGVVRENVENTKVHIMYNASATGKCNQPSLNDCLHPGPSLQNRLLDILIKLRIHPVLLTGNLQKTVLQIRIKEEDQDSLPFHWRPLNSSNNFVFYFTRDLFGLTCFPFLLNGVTTQHLDTWESQYQELISET